MCFSLSLNYSFRRPSSMPSHAHTLGYTTTNKLYLRSVSLRIATINMPAQRPRMPKTWHIATLAPGFDGTRLCFPIIVVSYPLLLTEISKTKERVSDKYEQATNDTSSKTRISSQSELDTLLKTHYGDAASDIQTTNSSLPQRNDSVVDLSTPNNKPQSNPFTDDYLTPLSSHFIDGELVCTGGLAVEHAESSDSSDSSDSPDYAKWLKREETEVVYGGDGRSFTVKLGARKWRKRNRVKKAMSRLRRGLLFLAAVQ